MTGLPLPERAAVQNESSQICEIQMAGSSENWFAAQMESRTAPDQPVFFDQLDLILKMTADEVWRIHG